MDMRSDGPGRVFTVARPAARGGRHAMRRPQRARGWLALTICCVVAIAAIALWIGPAPMMAPWDVFILLNEAYRMYLGQAPGAGFSNPIGPLAYGLTAIGMHLQQAPSLRAVVYGQVLFLAIASALAWIVAWRRLPAPYAAFFTLFVAVLSVADRPLGYAPGITTYAMLYNREGWLLYAPLLLLVLVPVRGEPGRKHAVTDGLALGLLLGLLFYDKITFFIAAIAAVGLGLLLGTLRRDQFLGVASLAGLGAVAGIMRLLLHVAASGYLSDLAQAAAVQLASTRTHMLAHTLAWISPVIILAAFVIAWLIASARRDGRPMAPVIRLALAAAYVLGSSALLSAGDASERSDLPALVVIPLLFVLFLEPGLPRWAGGRAARPETAPRSRVDALMLVAVAALLAGTTVPIAGQDALALGKAASYRGYVASPPASQAMDAGPYRDFVVPANSQWQTAYRTAYMMPSMINDGLRLLRANVRPGQVVYALAGTNPFSFALSLPPGGCGPVWWDLDYDFDQQHHASAQCTLGDAAWVIIPRMLPGQPPDTTVSLLLRVDSGYLSENFRQVAETSNWILLRRRA